MFRRRYIISFLSVSVLSMSTVGCKFPSSMSENQNLLPVKLDRGGASLEDARTGEFKVISDEFSYSVGTNPDKQKESPLYVEGRGTYIEFPDEVIVEFNSRYTESDVDRFERDYNAGGATSE